MTRKDYIVTVQHYDRNLHKCTTIEVWTDAWDEEDAVQQVANRYGRDSIVDVEQTNRDTQEHYDYE